MQIRSHPCGCCLRISEEHERKPCDVAAPLWATAQAAYEKAVETGNWKPYIDARQPVFDHYNQRPWDADAFVINYEGTYRRLQWAALYQLELWIDGCDADLKPHALVEYGIRFLEDYGEGSTW